MDDLTPPPLLTSAIGELGPVLVDILDRVYRDACDARAQFAGANEITFGTDIYQFAKYEVGQVAERTELLTILTEEEPKFRFGAGGRIFACHKVGTRADDDIRTSLPRARGAASMVEEQLVLPGVPLDLDPKALSSATRVVIAHMGNHEEGLCAVYLCIAGGDAEDEKIRGWTHTECLWKRDAQALAVSAAKRSELVAPEREADAEPRRRHVRKESGRGETA
jgi:hypothetical protein